MNANSEHNSIDTRDRLPGRFGLPLVGESVQYLRDPEGFIAERQQQYGNVFKTHLFGRPTVALIGADAVQVLFAKDGKQLQMTNTPNFEALLGQQSIGVQVGSAHQVLRRQLFTAFQPRMLESYAITITQNTHHYLKKWAAAETITLYDELKKYTLDIACQLFVGISSANDTQLSETYETWSSGLLAIPIRIPGGKLDRAIKARERLLNQFDQLIRDRRESLSSQESDQPQTDVLGILLTAKDEQDKVLSNEAIKDNLLAMLIAGHETLTSALTSLCQLLAQHPDILEKVREEQAQLAYPLHLTTDVLKQMTYLDQVVKEVLRLLPPVVRSGSRRVLEDCELGDYTIPKGWDVYFQIPETHQDSETYKNPERFDPERFSPERIEDRQRLFSHVPFGGGIRECLGKAFAQLEIKIFAALLVRGYGWEILPGQNLERTVLPFSKPRDGLKVRFSKLSDRYNQLTTEE